MSRLSDTDEFGNRMKSYEVVETARQLDPSLPIYARIDGRSFSRFTKGMGKPFSFDMSNAMIETTKHLVQSTNARIGYTQSDEISLVWLAEHRDGVGEPDIIFSGKVQKLVSVLASLAAAKFARVCPAGYEDRLPHFDCRVFQLPSKTEAANAFLWRAMDARKNAIAMAAQAEFSPAQLHGVDQKGMLELLASLGIDFDRRYPNFFKRGTFIRREVSERLLTPAELERIPPAHRPTGPVQRSHLVAIEMPPFNQVANRVEVIFNGADPLTIETPSLNLAPV